MLKEYNDLNQKEKIVSYPRMISKDWDSLKEILSYDGFVELFFVTIGTKPVSRITVDEKTYQILSDFCKRINLTITRSAFYIENEISFRGAAYASNLTTKPRKRSSRFYAYIFNDPKLIPSLEKADKSRNNRKLGLLLGYPKCCISHFSKTKFTRPGDYSMTGKKQHGPYSYLTNDTLWVFGITLLSHFICKPDCKRSITLAKRYIRTLNKYAPEYLNFIKNELSSLVILSRNGSIVYSNNYKKDGNQIELISFKGDPSDPLYKILKNENHISLKGASSFYIGKKLYRSPEFKLVIYQ